MLILKGNDLEYIFFVSPWKILSAANSGDLINGIGNSFLSVKGVFINPGETKDIFTLCFLKSK